MKKGSKKEIILLVGVILIVFGIGVFFTIQNKEHKETTETVKQTVNLNDSEKFKKEYEALNNTTNSNVIKVSIDKENPIVYSDYSKIMNKINNKETFVLYIGYSHCPWCRNAVPVLLEAAKQLEVKELYYLNISDNTLLFKDGKQENGYSKEALQAQHTFVQKLFESKVYDKIEAEMSESEKGQRLYSPTVLFIKEGEIQLSNVSTVESQSNPYESLTEEQHKELLNKYLEGFNIIK